MSTRPVGPPPPRRARPRRGLPPWAFGVMIVFGVVLLLAAAFLIGRLTAAAPKVAQLHDQGARPEIEAVPDAAATTDPIEGPAPFPQETTQTPILPSATPDDLSEAELSQKASPLARDGQKAAVAAYFAQMDVIGEAAKSTQNPETLARSVVDQTMSGNTSGIDELLVAKRRHPAKSTKREACAPSAGPSVSSSEPAARWPART
jgi:hypothetical protein